MAVIDREATAGETTRQERFADWFTTAAVWRLLLVAVSVDIVLFGVGPVPYLTRLDPFQPTTTVTEHSSPLMWIAFDVLNITNLTAAWIIHGVWLIGVLVASVALVRLWVSDFAGRLFVAVWFASPVANTQLTWLGKPDPGTLFATVLIGVGPPAACVAGGVLVGFNHFEQGVFIVAASAILRLAFKTGDRRTVAAMAGGLLAGRMLWQMYATLAGVESNTRLSYITDLGPGQISEVWRNDSPTFLFAALGVVWAPVIYMMMKVTSGRRDAVAVALVLAVIPAMLTLDATRVIALIAFPTALACSVWWSVNVDRTQVMRWLPWFLLAAVFVPRVQLWTTRRPFVSSWDRWPGWWL